MPRLQELVLELADRCPLECAHCSSESGPWCQTELPRARVLGLIGEAAELGAEKMSFGGGEPTGSPLLAQALHAAAHLGMRSELFTCGASRQSPRLEPIPEVLVDQISRVPTVTVIFSVHGPNRDLHDAVTRTRGSFDCMLRSLRACLAAHLRCEINFVPLRANYRAFPGVVDLAERHGISKVSILRFVPQGRGAKAREDLELGPTEEHAFVRSLLSLRACSGVEIRTGSPFNGLIPGNDVPCRAGAEKLVVQADGNVIPCEVFKHRDRRRWGLSVHCASLRAVLDAPQMQDLRTLLGKRGCAFCPVHHPGLEMTPEGANNGVPGAAVHA